MFNMEKKDLRVEIIKALEGRKRCPDCGEEDIYECDLLLGYTYRCNNCGEYFN